MTIFPLLSPVALPSDLRDRPRAPGGDGAMTAFATAILVMTLSAVDALATLVLIGLGCEEANPAMRLLLDRGPAAFLAGKLALTGVGCLALVALRDRPLFRTRVRAGHLLPVLVGLYLMLNAYQAALLALAPTRIG